MNKKNGYLLVLLSAVAGLAALPSALGAMHEQISTSVPVGGNNATLASGEGANATEVVPATPNEIVTPGENVTVTVTPFAQVPGRAVLVHAEGLEPNTNATITVANELAANTETDGNGTIFYALGVPSEPVTKMSIRHDNSTGEETISNDTHAWEGTVRVVVMDEEGNRGWGDLTVIAPVDRSNLTSTASTNITRGTLDGQVE